jgi:hypothetical protein
VEVDAAGGEASGGNNEAESDSVRKNEDRVACGLIAEFLRVRGMDNTLAVFVPETGGARNQLDSDAIVEVSAVIALLHGSCRRASHLDEVGTRADAPRDARAEAANGNALQSSAVAGRLC